MATRNTTLITKNSTGTFQNLPSTGNKGEGLVNLTDGILYYSGYTGGATSFVPSNNATGGYFEVGSNLYQLKIRDKITSYSGVTGLTGLFLSGTSNGFVLAPISSITGVDTYVTGFSYSANVITLTQNLGPYTPLTVTINTMTGLTVNGNLFVSGNETVNNLSITGSGFYSYAATGGSPTELVNYSSLTAFSQANDVYVTGNTYTAATSGTNNTYTGLLYHGTPLNGPFTLTGKDTFTTGGTYNSGTTSIDFKRNDGVTYSVLLSGIDINDTYVTGGTITTPPSNTSINGTIGLLYNQDIAPGTYTLPFTDVFTTGFTYDDANTFILKDNSGNTKTATINTVTGLTVNGNLTVTGTSTLNVLSATTIYSSGFTPQQVIYVGSGGELKGESSFTYDENTNLLTVTDISATGNVVIQGDLTVFGQGISAFTSQLYVEDPNVIFNYNPSASTIGSSVNAGITIQDGSGISGSSVNLDIIRLQNLTGLTVNQVPSIPYATEYPSLTGYANRGWITQLNDIVIRSTDVTDTDPSTPGAVNGVRVLAEFDILDGGTY